ncbi:MAG TPA: hypothetical protein VHV99_04815, partial [Paraburkholderia sp.]|nr:hypothetical protein [Paraburkholderia sp.]
MSVTAVQRKAVDPKEYGVPGNVGEGASSAEAVQSKPDGQSARQQSLRELLRSGPHLTKNDAQGREQNAARPAGTALRSKPDERAGMQASTLGRVQHAMARRGGVPDGRAGDQPGMAAAAPTPFDSTAQANLRDGVGVSASLSGAPMPGKSAALVQ